MLAAAFGLVTAGAAGCGIRLDRDPQMPDLSPVDTLRDAVARTLAATTADEGTADAISAFAAAVGPPWNPPEGLAEPVAPPNPDPAPFAAAEGLADAARRFVAAAPALGRRTGLTAVVLADVAAGALLHLSDLDPEAAGSIRGELADAVRTALDVGLTDQAGSGAPVDPGAHPSPAERDEAHPLAALITASHIAEYVYERASVHLAADSPARRESHARIAGLRGIMAIAPTLADDVTVPSSAPAWKLGERPDDGPTALAAIRGAEDALVERLWSARSAVPPAVFLSWLDDSARARRRADGFQDLRFEVAQRSPEEDG
ncbi:hypothetical protein BJEO58_00890 [Brevibacterium jeotgali]|uniref:DUF4439 domain-containing protein n=1 Tax=Brevibacterium jeotgali TaxID=1262550 RepID=A0A2H1L3K8_9MICO|nr:hypothetical protein FB108_1191 [Brevibacterium jeotgali]SMY11305.1 hypothetical protein BJEO58_00890 [Brevibacterium jeotgali]